MKILLVGNSVMSMAHLQNSLESHGLDSNQVVACTSEALGTSIATKCAMDIVILHPGMSGISSTIKGAAKKAYILLMAHPDDYETLPDELGQWVDDYITVPFSDAELSLRLRKAIPLSEPINVSRRQLDTPVDDPIKDPVETKPFLPEASGFDGITIVSSKSYTRSTERSIFEEETKPTTSVEDNQYEPRVTDESGDTDDLEPRSSRRKSNQSAPGSIIKIIFG